MKNIYTKSGMSKTVRLLSFVLISLFATIGQAQVIKSFTQRTSSYSPDKKIYNIKGDYTMIGNTNLTLVNYGDNTANSNNDMKYVDVDNDNNTFNSSSANLTFSKENGANPSCSNIIYAGLYWTGRAHNGTSSNIFNVTKSVPGSVPQTVNNDQTLSGGNSANYTAYSLAVSRSGSNNNRTITYTFTPVNSDGNTVVFVYAHNSGNQTLSVSVNGGTTTNVSTNSIDADNAYLTTPYVVYSKSGGITLTVNRFYRNGRNSQDSEARAYVHVSGTYYAPVNVTKEFNKQIVSIKGPGESIYTSVSANANDIYFPTTTDNYMYSAYAEVTDYVKAHGIGEYTVADIALREGDGGSTGFYGGWGLIVVYENSKMKWRDITIFDGHALVASPGFGSDAHYNLPVSGFKTVQSGGVNLKLGLMAGEGDRGIDGDYFKIQQLQTGNFVTLNHSGNTTDNFFNSSIVTGGNPRNPNILNNTGLDISMFDIANSGNSVIGNNQTQTTFQYGTVQDTYIIFCIAMAVDAYIPEIQAFNAIVSPPTSTVTPGQDIVYKVQIYNKGTEAVNNAKVVIPMPYTSNALAAVTNTVNFSPAVNQVSFNSSGTGSLIWEIGNLPIPADPNTLLAELTYTLKVTTDCYILSNPCIPKVTIDGVVSGVGSTSGSALTNGNFIQGFQTSGDCIGEPITTPLSITIERDAFVTANCTGTLPIKDLSFCNLSETTIPITSVSGSFTPGSRFYDNSLSVEYTINNPFPAKVGTTFYKAVPPGTSACTFDFTITVTSLTSVPTTTPVSYCVGETALPLTAIPSNTGYPLYYYTLPIGGSPTNSITPSTTTEGTTTYYVAEGPSGQCIGLNRASIEVTVNPSPIAPTSIIVDRDNLCPNDAGDITLAATGGSGSTMNWFANSCDGTSIGIGTSLTIASPSVTTTYYANWTNDCGNSTCASVTVNVEDVTPPVTPVLTGITGECTATATAPTTTDACAGIITGTTGDPLTYTSQGTHTIHWTFSDGNGNSTTADQTVTIDDVTPPVTLVLTGITGECTATATAPTTTDACAGIITGTTGDPLTYTSQGTHTIHWTFSDGNGNSTTADQTVTIDDITPPVTPVLTGITGECTATATAPTTTDACAGIITGTTGDPLTYTSQGTHTIHWTFSDGNGNSTTADQTVTIDDITPPVTPVLTGITGECTATATAPTTTDACAGIITGTTGDPLTYTSQGTHTIHWTFSDGNGNSTTADQTVTIDDVTPPVTPVLTGITGECTATATAPTTTDACAGIITGTTGDPLTYTSQGTHTIHWTFSDGNGNSTTADQTVTIDDVTPPVLNTPASVVVNCDAIPPVGTPVASDNCDNAPKVHYLGEISTKGSDPSLPSFTNYTLTRKWDATDEAGNQSPVSTQVITVVLNPLLKSIAGSYGPICIDAPDVQLSGTPSGGVWSGVGVSGDQTHGYLFDPSFGTQVLTYSYNAESNCVTFDETTIIVNPLPQISTGSYGPLCSDGADIALLGSPAGGIWTGTGVGGNQTDGYMFDPSVGTQNLTYTYTDGNGCQVSKSTLVPVTSRPKLQVTINGLTLSDNHDGIDDTGNFTICNSSTFNLNVSQVNDLNVVTPSDHVKVNQIFTLNNVSFAPVNDVIPINSYGPEDLNVSLIDPHVPGTLEMKGHIFFDSNNNDLLDADECAGDWIKYTVTVKPIPEDPVSISVDRNNLCPNDNGDITLTATGGFGYVMNWFADNCNGTPIGTGTSLTVESPAVTTIYYANWTTDCGSSACKSITVIVDDHEKPKITAPAAVSVNSDAGKCTATGVSLGIPVTTDNCTVASVTNDAVEPFASGNTTVTWTVTDGSGNTETATQVVTVTDHEKPKITAPAAVSVNSDAGKCTATGVSLGIPVTTDNCTVASVTNDAVEPFASGNTTVTWTVTDGSGNTETATQVVTVTDHEKPKITAPAAVSVNSDAGKCTATGVSLGIPVTTDNCTVASVTNDAVEPFASGNTTVTWTVTDGSGNTETATQVVTVTDHEKPKITAPAAVSVNSDAGKCTATGVSLGIPVTTDNCTVASVTNDAVEPFASGNTTVTWTVTDGSGNTETATQVVTVTDHEKPKITAPAAVSVNSDAGKCTATGVSLGIPVTTDNCTVASVTNDAVEPFASGNTTVTWTVTDGSGNTETATQVVTVADHEKPKITAPAAVSVNSDAGKCTATGVSLGTPVTTDNCTVASVTNDAVEPFASGNTTVTWTVTDGSGNTETATQVVTVTDHEKPKITAPAAVSVNSDAGKCTATGVSLGTPVTTDNCTVASVTNDAVEPFASGNTTVTWTVTDGSGNTETATQVVTVADHEKPKITAPAAVSVNSDAGKCTATGVSLGTPVTTDNCTVASVTNDAVEPFASGNTTVTWTVTDGSGNTETATQVVTVTDHEKPKITAPAAVSVNSDAGKCTATGVSLGTPVATDNCTVASVTNDAVEPFASGNTTVTWTVTDGSGNTETATQVVTVTDHEKPKITAPAAVSVNSDAGKCTATGVSLGTPVTTDNCTVASVTNDAVEPFASGNTTVTWTVTDGSGNTETATQVVTVTDHEKPKITAPAAVSVNSDAGKCTATGVSLGTPVATDNCTVASVTNDAVEPFASGNTTVTWTVTDGSGNTETATQVVTVTDHEKPKITAPAAVSVNSDAGKCTATGVSLGIPVTTDNCTVASVTNDAVEPFASGNTTVTWTVTDGSGNTETATQVVTVTDHEKPKITAPAAVSVNSDAGKCTATGVSLGTPVTTDNCTVASVTNDAVEPFASGNTTVTWTVTDGSGNTETATQVVTVTDHEKPKITAPAAVSVNSDAGKCTATGVSLGTPVTTDNCTVASVTNDAVEPFASGNTTVTWTVTDGSGNTETATQVVTVTDHEKPKITAPVAVSVNTDPGKNSASVVNLGSPVTTDNCTVASVTNDAVEPYPIGETTVTWTVTDAYGNRSTATQLVNVTDNEKPVFTICNAGENAAATDNDAIVSLTYIMTGATTGQGTTLNGVTFNVGETTLTWTAVDKSGNTSLCQTTLIVLPSNTPPIAVDDQFTVKEGTELRGDVRLNDSDAVVPIESLTVKLLAPAAHGQLVLNSNGTFTYVPVRDYIGSDQYTYEICKNDVLCDEAKVTITVTKNSDCSILIPNAFSPDGDGLNDYFKIKCIYNYPNAYLKIFTRSGIKVYEQDHYGNIDYWGSENDAWWNGKTGNKWNIGGNNLMSATYIYILELEKGNKKDVRTGTLFLGK